MELNLILSSVKEDLALFDQRLEENLSSDSALVSQVAGHLVNRKGKRLRPAMVFLSYGACMNSKVNSASNPQVMNVALAIEFIHTATLLHDDVIDQSKVRRGQVSVNHKWNNLVSVLMGDFLLAKSLRLIVATKSSPLLSTISKATENLSIGEMNEVQESHNFDLDEATYLQIISEKTASLFTASCESGAVAAGADAEVQKRLREYGQNLGMAFQITDDLLDWVGETEKTGKGLGNDLKEGKITLPLIHTLRESDQPSRKKLLKLLENDFNQKDFDKILSLIKGNGGVEYAQEKASAFGEKALSFLSELKDSKYKKTLQDLARFVIEREK
ncbi:MAG: polyprenyl synthetase family protein [candidate division Zixibacteria bacterium]|nr:polyprenyl synthetase family protein [candidate division Zixibacteria bacterium]